MLEKMGFKPARFWALNAALAEFLGGALLAVGFLTPIAAFMIIAAMTVAIATVHLPKGFFATNGGYELPLTFGIAAYALAIMGPGILSLDELLGIRLPEPATFVVALFLALGGALVALETRHLRIPQERPSARVS